METFLYVLIILILVITFIFDMFLSILNYQNRNAPIPEEVKDVYDEDNYKKWQNYNMENYRLSFISKIVHFILILSLLIFEVFPFFHQIAEDITQAIQLQTIIFLGFYYIITFIIGIFFSYYSQFVIEEKYGFNKMTLKLFIIDKIKGIILTAILGGGIVYLLTTIYDQFGNMFYIYAFISIIIIVIFINLFYVKLFVPIFNKLTPLEDGELKEKIITFAEDVGYEISKISVIDASRRSTKLNAFFSGFGKLKQVVLYDTLLEKMSNDEIMSVLAHEIGHSKQKHIIKNMFILVINLSIFLGVLYFSVKSASLNIAFGFNDANFGFGLITFMILISPLTLIIGSIISKLSRTYEYDADRYAAINYSKEAMIDALKVLGRENYANLTPHPLYVAMKYSHPPIAFRIRAINKINTQN